ncbi:hypothetical protein SAMN05216566_1042 [Aureimonas phyllosphaerae]|uniref:Uncharacterized protein n=1 Tax=Aureimonas phyllosphaerae TaxID=1166078 RepID=A0A7W6FTL3_9HYPH|nr:hypothetical protein [Aureimonas phyllosphaerae]MBB3958657.1 hypothetical protein [Aureimonas phyllosphaerae]SFF17546.1 hypothetical protein SAMN05216566_1042 [Aureimonas phyllosphaerae]
MSSRKSATGIMAALYVVIGIGVAGLLVLFFTRFFGGV